MPYDDRRCLETRKHEDIRIENEGFLKTANMQFKKMKIFLPVKSD